MFASKFLQFRYHDEGHRILFFSMYFVQLLGLRNRSKQSVVVAVGVVKRLVVVVVSRVGVVLVLKLVVVVVVVGDKTAVQVAQVEVCVVVVVVDVVVVVVVYIDAVEISGAVSHDMVVGITDFEVDFQNSVCIS